MHSTKSPSRLKRTLSAGLGIALLGGAFLVGAAPAAAVGMDAAEVDAAEADGLYDVTGTVSLLDAAGASSTVEGIEVTIHPPEYSPWTGTTAADGTFSFPDLTDGDYSLDVVHPASEEYGYELVDFTIAGGDLVLDPIVLKTYLDAGTLTVTGDPVVGETLSISTGGWPAGTTLTYGWGYSTGQSGGPIDGATASTLTVAAEHIGYSLGAFVTGAKDGFAPTTVSLFSDETVTAPKQAAAPAPVASSDELGSYLVGKGSTPQPQDSVGLPAGSLNPTKGYEAIVSWLAADSFVDVYLYSSPLFVGTFPVIDGVAQITLSADVLSRLGAGGHTLVVLGQSSGSVSSVDVNVAAVLASTGVEPVVAFSASGLFLLLGALSLLGARRMRSRV